MEASEEQSGHWSSSKKFQYCNENENGHFLEEIIFIEIYSEICSEICMGYFITRDCWEAPRPLKIENCWKAPGPLKIEN